MPDDNQQAEIKIEAPVSTYAIPNDQLPLETDNQDLRAVTWSASEFIAHEKSAGWYASLAGIAVILSVVVFLVTKDYVSVAVIVFGAIILGIYGARKPRQLTYQLDDDGLHVGHKQYAYDQFRSFAIMEDGAFSSIVLMPLKRFEPMITIYYAPEDEDKIIDVLAAYLPNEERSPDLVDRLMRRIRF